MMYKVKLAEGFLLLFKERFVSVNLEKPVCAGKKIN